MKKSILFFFMTLAACATTGDYQQELQQWIGASQSELYQTWGEPDSQFSITEETQIVTYIHIDNKAIGGNTTPYAGIEVAYQAIETPDYGDDLSNNDENSNFYYCKTSFTITNGQVVDFTFNGDDCVEKRY